MNTEARMYAPDYLRKIGLKIKDENLLNIASMIEDMIKRIDSLQLVAFQAQEMAKEISSAIDESKK